MPQQQNHKDKEDNNMKKKVFAMLFSVVLMLSNAPVVFAANVDGGSETGNTAPFSTQELEAR